MEKRTLREIAREIKAAWKNVYFGAQPYLDAMLTLDTTDLTATYYYESAEFIVRYFLANAQTFRGPEARRLKAELKAMLNG
jgi:hypothetical protein